MTTINELNATLERMVLIKNINEIDSLLDEHIKLINQEVKMIKEEYDKTVDGAMTLIAMHDLFYDKLCNVYSNDDDETTSKLIASLKEYRDLNFNLLVRYGVIVKFA